MDAHDAISLLSPTRRQLQPAGPWLDLGCGDGTFTLALADLLPAGSSIEAVDLDARALRRIPAVHAGVRIRATRRDFASLPFAWSGVAGILMANALHFVVDQEAFLSALSNALKPGGTLLVVEYDRDVPKGQWVPYPVSARALDTLAAATGFLPPVALGRRPSRFGGELYSAVLRSPPRRTFAKP